MKKTTLSLTILALLAGLAALGGVGCTVHAVRPALVVEPAPVVVTTPPPRVYYGGRWLYYRTDGYYYHHHGGWVVAPAVPRHVAHYHRPHPTHVRSVTHVRRQGPPAHHRSHRRQRRHRKVDADKLPFGVDALTKPALPA